MVAKRGRPPVLRQQVLAILREHHQAAGRDTPLPRGELLARLHGWDYGLQTVARQDPLIGPVPLSYTGIDRSRLDPRVYRAAQTALSRALLLLFGQGLVRLSSTWQPQLQSAEDFMRGMEEDLKDPSAAYDRYLAMGGDESLEDFLQRRWSVLATWQSGQGRLPFRIQSVALTERGRAAAERIPADVPMPPERQRA